MLYYVPPIWFTTINAVVLSPHTDMVKEILQPIDICLRTNFGSSKSLNINMSFVLPGISFSYFHSQTTISCSYNNWHVTLTIHNVKFSFIQAQWNT